MLCDCCETCRALPDSPLCAACSRKLSRQRRTAAVPTTASPGSADKVATLSLRFEAGLDLWHPRDGDGPATLTRRLPGVFDVRRVRRRYQARVRLKWPGASVKASLGYYLTEGAAEAACFAWYDDGLGPFRDRDEAAAALRQWKARRREAGA
jgi:hypothetical protein